PDSHPDAPTLVAVPQAVEAGITPVVDWCDMAKDDALLEAALSAHADSGVRTVLVAARCRATPTNDGTIAGASPSLASADLDAVAAQWRDARAAGKRIHARAGGAMP